MNHHFLHLTIIPQGHLHTYTLQRLMPFIYVKITTPIMFIFIRSSRSTLAITGRNLAVKCTKCNLGKSCIKSTERADWARTLNKSQCLPTTVSYSQQDHLVKATTSIACIITDTLNLLYSVCKLVIG